MSRLLIIAFALIPLRGFTQAVEYGLPEKLSTSVNTEAEESSPLLSFDGKVLFFTRSLSDENVGGRYTGSDIWMSERIGTGWKKAENRRNSFNSKSADAVIGMSATGDILYLMRTSSSRKVKGIYFSKLVNNVWANRDLIPIKGIEGYGFLSFYVSPDFDVLFISMNGKDSKGQEDLYISVKTGSSGEWSVPKNLGTTINTKGFEISPFLSADKKRLYFSSNGHSGMGDADIFVSERLYGSWEAWSVPQNLGRVINSEKFDAYFSVYDSVCFFSSNRNSAYANLFKAKVSVDNGEKDKQKIEGIVNETKSLLDELRSSAQSVIETTTSKTVIFYDDNTSSISASSKETLNVFLQALKANQAKKIKILYDGEAIDGSKASTMVNQERIRLLKQAMKASGVIESQIVVSPDLFSSESLRIRLNSLILQQE